MLKRGFSFAPGYRLEQFLGRGQFGQVWRASAPGGTSAAIKFIDLSGTEGAKEHAGIKRVKQIRHANLMPITAIWLLDVHGKPIEDAPELEQETLHQIPLDPRSTLGDLPAELEATAVSLPPAVTHPEAEAAWLVVGMLLGGKSLQQRLRECVKNGLPGIPPKELLAYMDESAKGLDFLNIAQHDLGDGLVAIQHCDVKPANIVLIGSSAVVCDFGLARILTRNQVTATSASGTPAYMAPEAIAGKPSRSSDQYSLAVTYYHLRTGSLPINDGTLWEVLDAHRTGKLDLTRVPEHEQAVLKRATALDWEKRFDSNLDFVESLREALRAEGFTRPVMPATTASPSSDSLPTSALPTSVLPANSMASNAVASNAVASNALDPSLTLVPDQDLTVPMGHTESVPTHRHEWWLQPQWLGLGAIAIVAPMLLIVLLSGGTEEAKPRDDDPRRSQAGVTQAEKSADDWLAEATLLLNKDEAAARQAFEAAAKTEPALLAMPNARLLTGHQGSIRGIEFSANSLSMVSIADEKMPFGWTLNTLTPATIGRVDKSMQDPRHAPVIGAREMIEAIAADPAHHSFATADFSGQLTLSSFSDYSKPLKTITLGGLTPESVIWHPSTNDLIVAGNEDLAVIVWIPRDSQESTQTYRFELPGLIQHATADPRGNDLLILNNEGVVSRIAWPEIEAIRKTSGAPIPKPITSGGTRVAVMAATYGLSREESALVTGGEDGEVTLWSLGAEPKAIHRQPIHGSQVSAIAVSQQGLQGPIVTGDVAGMIGVWRSSQSQAVTKLPVHQAAIASLDLSADGRWLAAGSFDGDVTLWHLAEQGLPMLRLKSAAGPVTFVRMDATGRWLATGHEEGMIELWDLRHAKMLVSESNAETTPPATVIKRSDDASSI